MPAKHSTISNILASKFTQHMSDRTNDEKLRILQERLAQIKEKQKRKAEIEIATPEEDIPQKERAPKSSGWVKYVGILGIVIIGAIVGMYFAFEPSDKVIEETQEFILEYDLDMPGENIVITASFEEEFLAKAMVNDLKVKFPKCDYFFLPDKSNSKEEVYKVFIGPYENEEETNQWTENLELDFEIIKL
jgi:hypothetical protein